EYVEERNGGYYLVGTRISLDSIVQCFNDGLSPETILSEFETLTLAQVFGAIAFYLEADNDLRSSIRTGVLRHEPFIDFQSALDAGLDGMPDPEVLRLAMVQSRILVWLPF